MTKQKMKTQSLLFLLLAACYSQDPLNSLSERDSSPREQNDLDELYSEDSHPDASSGEAPKNEELLAEAKPQTQEPAEPNSLKKTDAKKQNTDEMVALLDDIEEEKKVTLDDLLESSTPPPAPSTQDEGRMQLNALSLPISRPHRGSPGGLTANSLKTYQCRSKENQSGFIIHILDYRVSSIGSHPLCEVSLVRKDQSSEIIAYAKYQRQYCDQFTTQYIEEKKESFECLAVVDLGPVQTS